MTDLDISSPSPTAAPLPRKVLVVDDEPSILSALNEYLLRLDYRVYCAKNADEALEIFRASRPPVVITDLHMPGTDGSVLLKELKKLDSDVQVIIITGYATIESAILTLKGGAFDYILKPFRLEAVSHAMDKAREHLSLIRANRMLQENSIHVLEAMVKTLEQRDFYTAGHSRRVTAWSDSIAEEIRLDEHDRNLIHLAGLIHDVGKIGIDDTILRKPDRLTREEYEVIKTHPDLGIEIIQPLRFLRETIPIIRHHHERFDGTGYPGGLKGEEIPVGSRILTVADTFDAMTSSRAYRDALPAEAAVAELKSCSGTQFDPDLVEVFLKTEPQTF